MKYKNFKEYEESEEYILKILTSDVRYGDHPLITFKNGSGFECMDGKMRFGIIKKGKLIPEIVMWEDKCGEIIKLVYINYGVPLEWIKIYRRLNDISEL